MRWIERHVGRLARDAAAIGLPPPDRALAARGLAELARAAFPRGAGIVRLQVRPGDDGVSLLGTVRALGEEPDRWRAHPVPGGHPGPLGRGAKLAAREVYEEALRRARGAGAHEALLSDPAGHLIEGARSNLFVRGADGVAATPDLRRGGVAGLARGLALERMPEVDVRDIVVGEPLHEIVCVNAVRGAVPVVEVAGRPVGDGRPGPLAARLREVLETA